MYIKISPVLNTFYLSFNASNNFGQCQNNSIDFSKVSVFCFGYLFKDLWVFLLFAWLAEQNRIFRSNQGLWTVGLSQLWWETQPSEPRLPIFIIRFKKVFKKPSKSCPCLGWAIHIQILFKQRSLEFTVQPMANGNNTVQQDSRSQETDQFYDFFLHKQSLWPLSKW